MNIRQLGFLAGVAHLWAALLLLGSLLTETVLLYPNIFHDVPRSLRTTTDFLAVTNPGDVFPVIGTATLLTGVLAVVLGWRTRAARYRFLGGVASVALGDFLLSMLYMWERNEIMFEGTAVHSAAYLQQVATEFQTAHWFRLCAAALAAVLAFAGFLALHRQRVTAGRPD
ncbi:hypothetical protein SAMN05421810_103662 [Amycolatopsis arida]|uniref:DUF1772 domain-containing protein n=1 Tax=Amycolatopsis arida TaxID=587909 RepID=A0A1I5TUG5_9PSEU|nr:hypothetical protein [Amycolatopsis arida]TDX95962.1 hypothetical protein CLV69_10395 [Amycolatopsis arida]SFP86712.1 hypothetical protein SAMN05421810_103662 [Amycolatopsis arida]